MHAPLVLRPGHERAAEVPGDWLDGQAALLADLLGATGSTTRGSSRRARSEPTVLPIQVKAVDPPEHTGGWEIIRYELQVTYTISGVTSLETYTVVPPNLV